MSKFSRIYIRVLFQSLLTPLYFMSFYWLPFVKAFGDWPTQIVSGSFGNCWCLGFHPLDFSSCSVYAFPVTCISCHDRPLGNHHVLSVDISLWFSLGWLEVIVLGQQLNRSYCLGNGLITNFYWLTHLVVAVSFVRLLSFFVELILYTKIHCSGTTCL